MNRSDNQWPLFVAIGVGVLAVILVAFWFFAGGGEQEQPSANFSLNVVKVNSPVTRGEDLEVRVEVTNEGENAGTQKLRIYDHEAEAVVQSGDISLEAGTSETVTLTYTTESLETGNYTFSLETDSARTTFEFEVVEADESSTEETTREPDSQMAEDETETRDLSLPESVQRYMQLARTPYEAPAGFEKYRHQYTHDRLHALGNALEDFGGLLDQNSDLKDIRGVLKQKGDAIQQDWKEVHSDRVREALVTATDGFEKIRSQHFINMHEKTDQLGNQAKSLEVDVLYLEQIGKAEAYFQQSADLFEQMFNKLQEQNS